MSSRYRRLLESRILWKYLALILALVLLSIFMLQKYDKAFSSQNLVNGIFYSVVTSLIVAMFYDLGSRRELSQILDDERIEQRRLLTERLLQAIEFDRLPESECRPLAERLASSDRMMSLISQALLGPQGEEFFFTWLKPLVENRVLESATVEHRLCRLNGRDDAFTMEFHQHFQAAKAKDSYVIIFTCDNDLYNDLVTSGWGVDELAGTPTEEWPRIDEELTSLTFTAYRQKFGKRETVKVQPRSLHASEIQERLGHPVDGNLVRGFHFDLRSENDWHYEYSYRVTYLLSDPYYYWTAINPMFVRRLVIDYRELRPLMGEVSANCILGSASSDPHHDVDIGTYSVNVDSLVWPGQGALLVWRPDRTAAS